MLGQAKRCVWLLLWGWLGRNVWGSARYLHTLWHPRSEGLLDISFLTPPFLYYPSHAVVFQQLVFTKPTIYYLFIYYIYILSHLSTNKFRMSKGVFLPIMNLPLKLCYFPPQSQSKPVLGEHNQCSCIGPYTLEGPWTTGLLTPGVRQKGPALEQRFWVVYKRYHK